MHSSLLMSILQTIGYLVYIEHDLLDWDDCFKRVTISQGTFRSVVHYQIGNTAIYLSAEFYSKFQEFYNMGMIQFTNSPCLSDKILSVFITQLCFIKYFNSSFSLTTKKNMFTKVDSGKSSSSQED